MYILNVTIPPGEMITYKIYNDINEGRHCNTCCGNAHLLFKETNMYYWFNMLFCIFNYIYLYNENTMCNLQ